MKESKKKKKKSININVIWLAKKYSILSKKMRCKQMEKDTRNPKAFLHRTCSQMQILKDIVQAQNY